MSDAGINDDTLLEQAQRGDRRAFGELVFRHQKSIYRFLLRLLRNPSEAEDMTQKVFLLAFEHLSGFRREASFRTWIFRIAVNQCKNRARQSWRFDTDPPDPLTLCDTNPDPEETVASREIQQNLREAVEKLPEKQKMVLQLRVYQEMSFEEIGQIMQTNANTAKVNFHYAVEKIKQWLG